MKKLFLYIAVLAAVASCNAVDVDGDLSLDGKELASGKVTEIISGRQASSTKSTISNDVKPAFSWNKGDNIAVHVSKGDSHKYVSTADEGASGASVAAETAYFTVEYDKGYSRDAFAVYPSTIVAANAGNYGQTGSPLDVTLPSSYTLAEVSGTTTPCPMIADNTKSGWTFYQLCGLLRLTVNSIPPSAKSLKIDFNGNQVWGNFSIASPVTPGTSVIETTSLSVVSDTHDIITITPNGNAETLNDNQWLDGQVLNIPLPTGTYTNITVTAYNADGDTVLTMNRPFAYTATREYATKRTASFTVFPINSDKTKRVFFAPGNLQATTTDLGSTWTWSFTEHQYDYMGTGAGSANNLITGNGTVSGNGTVDIFFMSVNNFYGITKSYNSGTFNDWGTISTFTYKGVTTTYSPTYWKTLDADGDSAKEGWACAIKFRTDSYRFTLATINTEGTPVNGLIIFPLYYDGSTPPAGVVWRNINIQDFRSDTGRYPAWDNCSTCTTAGWEALEKDGCVFLPAAGYRSGSSMAEVGTYGGAQTQRYSHTRFDGTGYSVTQNATYATCVRLAHEVN